MQLSERFGRLLRPPVRDREPQSSDAPIRASPDGPLPTILTDLRSGVTVEGTASGFVCPPGLTDD